MKGAAMIAWLILFTVSLLMAALNYPRKPPPPRHTQAWMDSRMRQLEADVELMDAYWTAWEELQ